MSIALVTPEGRIADPELPKEHEALEGQDQGEEYRFWRYKGLVTQKGLREVHHEIRAERIKLLAVYSLDRLLLAAHNLPVWLDQLHQIGGALVSLKEGSTPATWSSGRGSMASGTGSGGASRHSKIETRKGAREWARSDRQCDGWLGND
jgi:hypothetical protein